MRTLTSYVIHGSRVTLHRTTNGWVALGIGVDGLPEASRPISSAAAMDILARYPEHSIIHHNDQ